MVPWDIWKQHSGKYLIMSSPFYLLGRTARSDDVLLQTHRMGDTSRVLLVMAWLDSLA